MDRFPEIVFLKLKQSFEGKENRAKHNRLQFIYHFGCLVAGGNFTVISTVISTVIFTVFLVVCVYGGFVRDFVRGFGKTVNHFSSGGEVLVCKGARSTGVIKGAHAHPQEGGVKMT